MADYLTLNGFPIPVKAGGLLPPSRYGETLRMYNNRLRSTEEPLLRTRIWQFSTGPLTAAEWAAVRPQLINPGVAAAGGYAITRGATPVGVLIQPGEIPNEPDGDLSTRYSATFLLLEQSPNTALVGGFTTAVFLTGLASDLTHPGGSLLFASISGPVPGDPGGFASGGTPVECGSGTAGACDTARCPSVTTIVQRWATEKLEAGTLDGPGSYQSDGIGINPWGSWWTQRIGIQVSIIDGDDASVVLDGPYAFTTAPVWFGGGALGGVTVSPFVSLPYPDGSRLFFEGLTIIGLNGCRPDDSFRPGFSYGASTTQVLLPALILPDV